MTNVVIIGATSAIAQAVARRYARAGARLHLTARDAVRLEAIADDLAVRGATKVDTTVLDVDDHDRHDACIARMFDELIPVDVVLVAHGTLPDQEACEASAALTVAELQTNGVSTISLATILANRLAAQGRGTLAVITSVAGDRGRQSNYVYGAAKGMTSIFLEGLAHRLQDTDVRILDIKPGFVDTPMTSQFEKGLLWVGPDRAAAVIHRRLESGSSFGYVPSWWWAIMRLVRWCPTPIFHRTKL